MQQAPHYSADRFPLDFRASALAGLLFGAVCGLLSWSLARHYLQQTYPGYPELLSAAIVVGLIDGCLLGLGSFIATFALRIFRHEHQQRRRSDQLLRRDLETLHESHPGEPDRPRRD